jgi:hypothetical protein
VESESEGKEAGPAGAGWTVKVFTCQAEQLEPVGQVLTQSPEREFSEFLDLSLKCLCLHIFHKLFKDTHNPQKFQINYWRG